MVYLAIIYPDQLLIELLFASDVSTWRVYRTIKVQRVIEIGYIISSVFAEIIQEVSVDGFVLIWFKGLAVVAGVSLVLNVVFKVAENFLLLIVLVLKLLKLFLKL